MSKTLVLAETNGNEILASTLSAIAFAQTLKRINGAPFDLVVIGGAALSSNLDQWAKYGAESIYTVTGEGLDHLVADVAAAVCQVAYQKSNADMLVATATTFGKDVLPRVSTLLKLPMVSDAIHIAVEADGSLQFKRPVYAGNLIATLQLDGPGVVVSVRGTAFTAPEETASTSSVIHLDIPDRHALAEWKSVDSAQQSRPELTAARVVVSGGRPLKDAATFEKLIGGLADKLGGAAGATRAAVDSGIAPNELQVGQTGKAVAPQLYIAAGISGSVQHIAGMKDSKVIVGINTDPDAPIFQVADYGLVADLYQAIPELIESL